MRTALLAAVVASLLGQSDVPQFAGTWIADHGGRPLVRLELRVAGETVTGTIQIADLHVDARGDVETVLSDLSPRAPIADVAIRSRTLTFTRRDGDDVDHFELALSDAGVAELRFIPTEAERKELADDGIPLPKPIRLTRHP